MTLIEEDKLSLTSKRAELVERLATPLLPPEDRVRVQGEISVLNARIKALNTTAAAQLKAAADRRKAAGLAEAQANAARARANLNGGAIAEPIDDEPEDDDPGQTAAIDGWIDAVLLRHDVDFARDAKGTLMVTSDPSRAHVPQNLAAAIELLVAGVYAAARSQELPDLPSEAPKPAAKPKKPKKR